MQSVKQPILPNIRSENVHEIKRDRIERLQLQRNVESGAKQNIFCQKPEGEAVELLKYTTTFTASYIQFNWSNSNRVCS